MQQCKTKYKLVIINSYLVYNSKEVPDEYAKDIG